jgi:hypothetical protein
MCCGAWSLTLFLVTNATCLTHLIVGVVAVHAQDGPNSVKAALKFSQQQARQSHLVKEFAALAIVNALKGSSCRSSAHLFQLVNCNASMIDSDGRNIHK